MNNAFLSDALADALGRVVADVQQEWRKEVDRSIAESRALIAEQRLEIERLKSELRCAADREIHRVSEVLASVKNGSDGAPGLPGEKGEDGLPGQKGDTGPEGKPGQDGKDADPAVIARMVADAVADIPRPQDGKDAQALIERLVAEHVQKAVSDIEPPPGPKGDPGEKGEDGVGLAGALIDRDGELVVTLTNGTQRSLGAVIGKDGCDGKPGRDGFGFDDLTVEHDGERTFKFCFARGDQTKEFPFTVPVMLDRGVYRSEQNYQKGDAVSFGGSIWIAQEDTTDKPETSKAWRLAVKRGQNGKDAK
jgi:integrin beta 3